MDSDKLSKIALDCVTLIICSGASFDEGQAILKCALALIKQVDLTPTMDDDGIATMAMAMIAAEIKTPSQT